MKRSVRQRRGGSGNLEVVSTRSGVNEERVSTYDGHGIRLESR